MAKSDKVYGFNTPQRLFVGYTLAVLVDLVVLNFFDEYWDFVNCTNSDLIRQLPTF
ncbi:hypothetical protein VCRA2113O324_220001 [Vibrio crassostreae]|uniref:hypothetical protein n=1 Tax=Vibrio crassostreae TaxID=246167 RepID=UPI000F990167|nr:hypothetical protein [Vibrio crassostreae]ROO53835.1 hypothetical protein EDB58_1091 [Vibrio crassostreae]CAK1918541.1 hypothetical protein VCRA2113O324_220001 [Vibrio crassostreae]CAK1942786.1 hypothetical protein VCRA2111O320_240001 [Vibrio crassostreae]CAK2799789.1 hypothetical protein VCRA2121O336_230001 [Vibrio crassostreae]CAK3308002.1 hypothetical protein VCRA2120O329_220074 [Vibrio crassostreae]